ncbi:MAG: hypothetical protein ACRDJL_06260 [Actinomycetota bacterium]
MLQISQRPLSGSDADARLFVDREREVGAALRALELSFNVLVLGDPKAGRTSFLRHLERRAAEEDRLTAFADGHVHETPALLVEGLRAALRGEARGQPAEAGATVTESDVEAMASATDEATVVFVDNLSPGCFADPVRALPRRSVAVPPSVGGVRTSCQTLGVP